MYYFDFQSVITPVNVNLLVHLLEQSNYDETKIGFLQSGFAEGFDIGYEGPMDRQSRADFLLVTRLFYGTS